MGLGKNQEHRTAPEYPSDTHRLIILENLEFVLVL